jgi:hypothetical protein
MTMEIEDAEKAINGDLFSEENQVKANFWKLEKPGDSVKGVLVEKHLSLNKLKQPNCKQTVYTIMQDDGVPILISGRGNGDPQVIAGLESCKLGQYVGVKYVEDRKSTAPGMHDAKIVRVYTTGKMDQATLDKFNGVSTDDVM